MFHLIVIIAFVALGAGAAGFGLGRIKNSAKLKAIDAEIVKIETDTVSSVTATARSLAAAIRKHI